MVNRVKALIHLDNLLHNYNLLKEIHHDKRVLAVVKADAYGHGSVQVAKHLEKNGCDFFAVTDIIEAIELRKAGIKANILIFGKTSPSLVEKIRDYKLIQTIDSYEYAKALNDQTIEINSHVIIDSGMSRYGIYCHREDDILNTSLELENILSLPYINHQGIYTHFAVADEDKEAYTKSQYDVFINLIKSMESRGYHLGIKHCSNSAAILKYPDRNLDMVRAGIAMYGYPPVKTSFDFLPVMEVFAKVISLRDIKRGDGVSYGLTHIASKASKLASIAIGYGDGYDRLLTNQDYFIFNNKKLKVVGRICMGVTMVELNHVNIKEGDLVEVFGLNKPLEEMAKKIDTISYELLTNMSKKRVVFEYDTNKS